jgi:hypothetical protein
LGEGESAEELDVEHAEPEEALGCDGGDGEGFGKLEGGSTGALAQGGIAEGSELGLKVSDRGQGSALRSWRPMRCRNFPARDTVVLSLLFTASNLKGEGHCWGWRALKESSLKAWERAALEGARG